MKLLIYDEKECKYEKISPIYYLLLLLMVVIIGIISYSFGEIDGRTMELKNINNKLNSTEKSINIVKDEPFSKKLFKEYLLEINIKFPEIIYGQAVVETGDFTSNIFKSNNNLFGMKMAKSRATTNQGADFGHAVYSHWKESVLDYALYQCAYLSNINSKQEYLQYLNKNYAGTPDYINMVQKAANEFSKK